MKTYKYTEITPEDALRALVENDCKPIEEGYVFRDRHCQIWEHRPLTGVSLNDELRFLSVVSWQYCAKVEEVEEEVSIPNKNDLIEIEGRGMAFVIAAYKHPDIAGYIACIQGPATGTESPAGRYFGLHKSEKWRPAKAFTRESLEAALGTAVDGISSQSIAEKIFNS